MKQIKLQNKHFLDHTITVGWGDNNRPIFQPTPEKSPLAKLLYQWLDQEHPTVKSNTHLTQYVNGLQHEGSFWNGIRQAYRLGFTKYHEQPHEKIDWQKELQ